MTFEKIKELFGEHEPDNLESVQSFIAGKVGQWLNQQSHIDREEAADKAIEIVKLLLTEEMYQECMPEGKFDRDRTYDVADNFFQILAWHYQYHDPSNLGQSVLVRAGINISEDHDKST